jgi:DNA-binding NarL/FixJ family response regulator
VTLTRQTGGGSSQQLLDADAKGYVLKQSDSDEVRAGDSRGRPRSNLPRSGGRGTRRSYGRAERVGSPHDEVVERRECEEEVLRMVAWGLLTRDTAERLQISIKSVEAQ